MDCSLAKNYIKEKSRMTNKCIIDCTICHLDKENNGYSLPCSIFEEEYPEEAIKIVQKWSDKHPKITNKEKFIEVMENTFGLELKISSNDCPPLATYEDKLCHTKCEECRKWWDKPYDKSEVE